MTDITEADLFEALLASEELPTYDPKRHLCAKVAADRWKVNEKTALPMLRARADEFGLIEITVRNPKTGKRLQVFIPKRD